MAAKFISANDPTGEVTLKHWIAQGQIQDPHQVFSLFWTSSVFRGCNAHRLLDLQQDIAKCLDLLNFSGLRKTNSTKHTKH